MQDGVDHVADPANWAELPPTGADHRCRAWREPGDCAVSPFACSAPRLSCGRSSRGSSRTAWPDTRASSAASPLPSSIGGFASGQQRGEHPTDPRLDRAEGVKRSASAASRRGRRPILAVPSVSSAAQQQFDPRPPEYRCAWTAAVAAGARVTRSIARRDAQSRVLNREVASALNRLARPWNFVTRDRVASEEAVLRTTGR